MGFCIFSTFAAFTIKCIVAKKTIISDFSSLKGKISFSENIPVAQSRSTPDIHPVNKTSDRELKVGQKIVMMDSNERGTIISLGNIVGIELEDGLKVQATYGEFAIIDDQERTALKEGKIKTKKVIHQTNESKMSSNSSMMTVDLHIEALPCGRYVPKGQQLEFQMNAFKRAIQENLSRRGFKICFIHGIGDGILKAAIRRELDEVLALRCSYVVGDPAITIVTIR